MDRPERVLEQWSVLQVLAMAEEALEKLCRAPGTEEGPELRSALHVAGIIRKMLARPEKRVWNWDTIT